MFGIMKACSCHKGSEERELRRMHYCGTCKTIGRLYGQKARVFLNYDAVFLGEVLADLQGNPLQFAPAYVSKNCFSIPQSDQVPFPLEYAAAANVVLAQFKLLDHVADSGSKLIRLVVRAYSQEFQKASQALSDWKFPFQDLEALMALQSVRECEASPRLECLAEPTAGATSLVFRHGAISIGAASEVAETMVNLGARFGEIAYLADAIRDKPEDAKKREFNALVATRTSARRARKLLREKQQEMVSLLEALPIEEARKENYSSRLQANLAPLLFRRQRPGRVVVVRDRRPGIMDSCCPDCCADICCCQAEMCCEGASFGCCECICSGC